MDTADHTDTQSDDLSQVAIKLLKGVVYEEDDRKLWQQLLNL